MVTGLADKGLVHFVLRLITLFPVPSNKCYRGLSWKLAERTLGRMQYLPQNIWWRWVLCQPLSTQQRRQVCVSKFYKCQKCKQVISHQKRMPEDRMCKGKSWVRIAKSLLNQTNTNVMWSQLSIRKIQLEHTQRNRTWVSEDIINQVVEEEEGDTEGEEAQEYLFFNTESRQDDDRHISTLLIVQDDRRFEMIFKGNDLH